MANAMKIVQKRFNSGYVASLHNKAGRERYTQTLSLLSGTDEDNICMYFILYPSTYTRDKMLNYKALIVSKSSNVDG